MLGDALKSLLLGRSQEEWDVVLLQIMRAYHSTRHFSMQETPKLPDVRLRDTVPEHLTYHVPAPEYMSTWGSWWKLLQYVYEIKV